MPSRTPGFIGAERDVAHGGPEQRHQQRAPGDRLANVRQRRHQHAVDQANDQRHDDVNDNAHHEQRRMELLQLGRRSCCRRRAAPCRRADSPATRCRGRSRAVDQRRQRHHQPADDAALDAGRDGMHLHRQPQAIAGHAAPQSFDFAGRRRDRLRAQRRLDERLVPVAAAGQQAGRSTCPARATNTTPPTNKNARLVATPTPASTMPTASTSGAAVGLGISTDRWIVCGMRFVHHATPLRLAT